MKRYERYERLKPKIQNEIQDERLKPKIQIKPKIQKVTGVNPSGFHWLIGLMTLGLMIGLPMISQAMPGAKLVITDNPNHKVIEVDPTTNAIVWEYGGSQTLNYPNEAFALTNGNILIADTYNERIIEVRTSDNTIVNTINATTLGSTTMPFKPVDMKRCVAYPGGIPTLLITNMAYNEVIEVEYPSGNPVWKCGHGNLIFEKPWEAEKRPGAGTPTYLITDRGNNQVIVVERISPSDGQVIWQYGLGLLNDPRDAEWTPCGNVLITDTDNQRVIEVDPDTNAIVWQYGPGDPENGTVTPYESTRIENGNTLIAGVWGNWDDLKDGKYQNLSANMSVFEIASKGGNLVWSYAMTYPNVYVDVDEKGIINIAKIEYRNMLEQAMPKVFAGVVVPIYQPVITYVGTPTIVATKTVTPLGSQTIGATLTYTIELTNTGNGTATAVTVTDQVPDGTKLVIGSVVFVGIVPDGSYVMVSHDGGQTYDSYYTEPITHCRWTIPEVESGGSVTMEFQVVIQP
ncbi:MAG: hypothetical protein ABIF11_07155 [Nitrospirota bacterium]